MLDMRNFILLILSLISHASLAAEYALPVDGTMLSYGYQPNSKLNLEKLMDVFKQAQAKSVPQALAAMKAAAPEYFEHSILMYRSQSLQEASFQAPRVFLSDRSAELIVTFNGNPKHRGYQKLEVMQFRAETLKFEFREIDFTNGEMRLSEANPKTCLQCHQSASRVGVDPRPNWEPYNVWPGAYGSQSGSIGAISDYHQAKLKPEDQVMANEQRQEEIQLPIFWHQTRPRHDRYRHLEFKNLSSSGQPMGDNSLFDNMAHETVSFTERLSNLSLRRMIRLTKQDQPLAFERVKYNLTSLMKCQKIQVPEDIRRGLLARVNAQGVFNIATEKTKPPMYAFGDGSQEGGSGPYQMIDPPPHWNHTFSEELVLLFEAQGVSTLDWSTDFGTRGRLAFIERFGRPSNMQVTSFLFKVQEPKISQFTCDQLQELAVIEAQGFRQWLESQSEEALRPARTSADPQKLLARCTNCHQASAAPSSDAPWIAFDDPALLSEQLLSSRASSGRILLDEIVYRLGDHAVLADQMPPSLRRPEPEERQGLIEYLRNLARSHSRKVDGPPSL